MTSTFADEFVRDLADHLRRLKGQCESAWAQVDPKQRLFAQPAAESNSVAVIVKHVAGNLNSRFENFLSADGESPLRDRDGEFVTKEGDTWESLVSQWEAGWARLFATISTLQEAELLQTVTIRGERMTAMSALHRCLAHLAYHTGQILYLCKLLVPEGWVWLTIAPGKSSEYNEKMGARTRGGT